MEQSAVQATIAQSISNGNEAIIETISQQSVITNGSIIGEKLSNVTQSIIQSVHNSQEDSGIGALLPIIIGLVVIGIVLYVMLTKKKSGNQNIVALIGERYSGKTQLFMRLNGGKLFETVPSIKNNQTSFKMPSSRKTYQIVDYCGDGISKDEILHQENYVNLHTLVHVIDGTDATKLGDAGLFMYRMLVNKSFQKRECNYILFLNKTDNQNFLTRAKIIKRLQDEIEHIKQSRKNSSEESEEEEDYLKTTKERFNLEKSGIKVVVGAVKNGEVKEIQAVLEEVL